MKNDFRCVAATTVALALSATVATAANVTVFTNLSGTPPFNGSVIYGLQNFGQPAFAMPFTASVTADLTDAVLALELENPAGTNTPLSLNLYADSGGLPDSVLATLSQVGTISTAPSLITFDYSGPHVTLDAGTPYWLAPVQSDINTLDGWLSSNGSTGPVAGLFSGGTPPFHIVFSNDNIAAFEVDGITRGPAVPESSIWAMMLVGFAGLGFVAFRWRPYKDTTIQIWTSSR
jgi:hypothetical protein